MELNDQLSLTDFENNYWYAAELKWYAKSLGVKNTAKLRKDQLENIIRDYLKNGCLLADELTETAIQKAANKNSKAKKSQGKAMQLPSTPDHLAGPLTLDTEIKNYCSNATTKSFIVAEAAKVQPNFSKKSGAWYWLNRWREAQMIKRKKVTYGDLVQQFLVLSNNKGRLPQIPSAKMNNFISDFLLAKAGNLEAARAAWQELKALDIPKTYKAWSEQEKES